MRLDAAQRQRGPEGVARLPPFEAGASVACMALAVERRPAKRILTIARDCGPDRWKPFAGWLRFWAKKRERWAGFGACESEATAMTACSDSGRSANPLK